MDGLPPKRARRRGLVYVLLTLGLLVGALPVHRGGWQGTAELHTLFETIATLLGLIVGAMALVRYYTKKSGTYLFLGTGFLGGALLDGYHAMVTSSFLAGHVPAALSSLTPWSGIMSRVFMSLLFCASVLTWKREMPRPTEGRIKESLVYGLVGTWVAATFLFFALVRVPPPFHPNHMVHRPADFLPALFFALATAGYLRKGSWKTDDFEHWLVFSLILYGVSHLGYMAFYSRPFDAQYFVAHALNIVGHITVLTGLFISMFSIFKSEARSTTDLLQVNRLLATQLDLERRLRCDISVLRRAEEALRTSEKRYRQLFERNLAGVFRCTLEGRILECNQAAACMLGYDSPEEIMALPNASHYCKDSDREAFVAKLKSEKSLTNYEARFRRKDGKTVWAIENASLVEDDAGIASIVEGTLVDITERKVAEERLRQLSGAVEQSPASVVITDLQGNIEYVNPKFTQLTGYTAEEAIGQNPRILKSGMQSAAVYRELWGTVLSGGEWRGEIANKKKNGEIYWETASIVPIKDSVGAITHLLAVKEDITERKQAEKMLQLTQFSLEHASDSIFWMDPQGRVVYANESACRSLGRSREELLSLAIPDIDPFSRKETWGALWGEIKTRGSTTFEAQHKTRQGQVFPTEVTANYVEFDGQEYAFSFVRDITERKVAEERVQSLAYYDALTGLPNRILLRDRLSKALAAARRQKHKVALLFLDLDRFKIINDSLGHSVGDLLLQDVAERLKRCAREQDTVARLGGDEFLIVLTNVKDIPDAAVATERFMDAMTAGFVIQGHSLSISCSLGISIFPEHGADSETLIKNADAAMYRAKDYGRNNFQFFTADMNAQAVERLTLENGLRLALDKKELFLVYQPQMDIATGKITGLEALLRWQHPELGLVPPDKFIRIAENSGLIMPIGEWVLRTACFQARKWQDEGRTAVSVAVNVSAVQFRQEGFPQTVCRVLHETGVAPQYLELELTESLLLSNADVMFSVLQQLTAMGLRLAIDDFGTGYSSLSYLRQFPVSKLKIDRSFVRDVAVNPDDAAITTAIISMAKSLNLKVIAEGVETEAQMSFLRAHQCDEIQGYYFSKPLATDEVADKLRADYCEGHVRTQASGRQS